jgi:hypothetical protein
VDTAAAGPRTAALHVSNRNRADPKLEANENCTRKGEKTMPLVTIKVCKSDLSYSQGKDLIRRVTEAMIPFVGEKLRDNTWVLIEENC